jgi:drug/metabolite transporter (DMT)-like permease
MASVILDPDIRSQRNKIAQHRTTAELLMLVTTFCWASNIVAGKEALEGFSALALAQLRMALAAIFYAGLFFLWRGRPSLRLTAKQWLLLGLAAFTGITLNQMCFLGGLARTSVIHTGLIQALGPIMVLLLSVSVGREALTLRNCTGMVIAFAGVAILLDAKQPSGNGAHWTGDLILVAAGASFALYTLLMKDAAADYDPLTLSTLTFGLGALLLAPFCMGSLLAVKWGRVPFRAWMGLAFLIVFGSVVAYMIYAFSLRVLSASQAAAFNYLQPAIAAGLGVWLIGERLTLAALAGGVLILTGVYLTEREHSLRTSKSRAVARERCESTVTSSLRALPSWSRVRRLAAFAPLIGRRSNPHLTTSVSGASEQARGRRSLDSFGAPVGGNFAFARRQIRVEIAFSPRITGGFSHGSKD